MILQLGTRALTKIVLLTAVVGGSVPIPSEGQEYPRTPLPDTSRHSVPLDEIYFDTFRTVNRAVPLSEAPAELIRRLQDMIPPLHHPDYVSVDEADEWLQGEDVVLGYESEGRAWAYPVKVLNYHEIVNDSLAGDPVLISYCPLCASGAVFSRQTGDRALTFGNTSALYESDMVMVDYETGSYWWQVAGESIVGALTGQRLSLLPSTMVRWKHWRELHPYTRVLSFETGFDRDYRRDPFAAYAEEVNQGRFLFPVSQRGRDQRLPPAARVLVVRLGGAIRAYPLDADEPTAYVDELSRQSIVVLVDGDGGGAAFRSSIGGRLLSLEVRGGRFVDRETGSTWDLAGRALSGELEGDRLQPLPVRTTYWFAAVAADPEVTVYRPDR